VHRFSRVRGVRVKIRREYISKHGRLKCEVCGATETMCIDHDHVTGEFRGMLCNGCNAALGLLKEDFYRIMGLADYLLRHMKKHHKTTKRRKQKGYTQRPRSLKRAQ
jgi:hypothetical protein